MLNNIKLELYERMKNGYDGQCTIIYEKNGIKYLEHTHNKKFTIRLINEIPFDDILYICCQNGYSVIKKESNPATDTEIGCIQFSSYDDPKHVEFYTYMESIYTKFGVENYED